MDEVPNRVCDQDRRLERVMFFPFYFLYFGGDFFFSLFGFLTQGEVESVNWSSPLAKYRLRFMGRPSWTQEMGTMSNWGSAEVPRESVL